MGLGRQNEALRNYIERMDQQKMDEFTRRTGLKPVTESEYLSYLLSIGRSELAPAIDLPTKLWIEEIGRHAKPMPEAERAEFEKRLDAWSGYLMGLYQEVYGAITKNLRGVDPALRNSSSVQSDHAAVRQGQYFPSAYAPLDFQYQSTWNDQVGGPDYVYQWLLVDALLEMERGDKPTWISNALGGRTTARKSPASSCGSPPTGCPSASAGIGFAHEGFSNILGGMNKETNWEEIKGKSGEADLRGGTRLPRSFRRSCGRGAGAHGVGILWSKTQYGRQHVVMGFGNAVLQRACGTDPPRLHAALRHRGRDRHGPRGRRGGIGRHRSDLCAAGESECRTGRLHEEWRAHPGGRLDYRCDSRRGKIPMTFPFTVPGKPHSWTAPNMVGNENDTMLFERAYPELAKAFSEALGDTGHAWLKSGKGVDSRVSLLQIDGGRDARYIVAVNDSWVSTQADWHQVKETLVPLAGSGGEPSRKGFLYDCTDESAGWAEAV